MNGFHGKDIFSKGAYLKIVLFSSFCENLDGNQTDTCHK